MLIILNVKQKFLRSVNQNRNLRDRWNWILEKWTFSVLKVFVLLPSPLGFIISRHGSLTPERTSGTTCQTALISSRWAVAMVTGPPVISRDVSGLKLKCKAAPEEQTLSSGGKLLSFIKRCWKIPSRVSVESVLNRFYLQTPVSVTDQLMKVFDPFFFCQI